MYLKKRFAPGSIIRYCAVFLLIVELGHSQTRQTATDAANLMERLKRGTVPLVTINQIADAQIIEALPLLRKQFDENHAASAPPDIMPNEDLMRKAAIASAIIRLGAKEEVYWNFLTAYAKPAIDSDAPFPMLVDKKTQRANVAQPPQEFLAWAKLRNVSPESAANVQLVAMPSRIIPLAATGDRRGLPLLRKALSSPNYMVQIHAAAGLALLRDRDSISLIIEACNKAPSDLTKIMARALVFFDDDRAKAASERFIQERDILEEFRKLKRERGPRALF